MANVKSLYTIATVLILIGVSACTEFRECGAEGCANDRKITAKVQARLDQQPDLGAPGSITVQTLNRVVYLNGLVAYGLEKSNAESVAKQVPGVTQVVNNIAVEH
jgi:osmotically-inducible protein OsmY